MKRWPQTIFALATAPGRAAISIVRISGPASDRALKTIAGSLPKPRRLSLRRLVDPIDGAQLDDALVVRFPSGSSFTGETSAELHLHGGRAVAARVLGVLAALPDLRVAAPGEFTRRAVLNGKIGLAEAEGIADLVAAETELQRTYALALVSGELSKLVGRWRARLVSVMANLEAALDFSDEPGISDSLVAEIRPEIKALGAEIGAIAAGRQFGRRVREGFSVAVVGTANAGKSTLVNRIAGVDAAIVSSEPGATRDVIRVLCDLDGLPVWFFDTAGLRVTSDQVEAEGVARALRASDEADLRLFVTAPDVSAVVDVRLPWPVFRPGDIRVSLKADLGESAGDIAVSAHDGLGMDQLVGMIRESLLSRSPASPVLASERQARQLLDAKDALALAFAEEAIEIAADHLRSAALSLDLVIGKVDVEVILDEVFSRFCIGK